MAEETPIHKRAVIFTMPGQDSVYIERDIVYNSIGDQDLLLDVYRVINYPQGQHGFDILDDNLRSQQIIGRTLAFIQENI